MDDRQRKEAGRAGEAAALAHLRAGGLQLIAAQLSLQGAARSTW